MAEIKINVNALNDGITRLKNLRTTCQNTKNKIPETVGGGLTVNELESIASLSKDLDMGFNNLVSNTISFMENLKGSFEESDNKAAEKLSGVAVDVEKNVMNKPLHTGNNHPPERIDPKIAKTVAELS